MIRKICFQVYSWQFEAATTCVEGNKNLHKNFGTRDILPELVVEEAGIVATDSEPAYIVFKNAWAHDSFYIILISPSSSIPP